MRNVTAPQQRTGFGAGISDHCHLRPSIRRTERRELTWSWSVYKAFHLNEVLQTWARFPPRKMGRKDIPG